MRLVATMAARNDQWVIAYSLRAVLEWCDAAVVLLHACDDGTAMIVDQIAVETGRVIVLVESNPEWEEMRHRQRMLDAARAAGADYIAIVDSDEVLTANLYDRVRATADGMRAGDVLQTPWLNLWRSLDMYRSDNSKHARQWLSLVFRDDPSLHWGGEERFHHRHPFNSRPGPNMPPARAEGGALHLQRANWQRARARQARYKVIERVRWPHKSNAEVNRPYSESLDETGLALTAVPADWWPNIDRGLIDNEVEPWEQGEVRQMVIQYGSERFAGLDLFGIDA